jgi:hypothetical protein
LKHPGVFTIKKIAQELETTVGDLLGEANRVSAAEERIVRAALPILQRILGQRRFGFLQGEIKIPDDFDRWGEREILA